MKDLYQTETVTIKACCDCSGGLLDRDRFCRWCGARQTGSFMPGGEISFDREETHFLSDSRSLYTTSPLEKAGEKSAALRPVSGPLVQAMIAGMTASSSAPLYNRALPSVLQLLVSFPIWLMIVLLSPFDAYAAAKSISRQFTPEAAPSSVCERKPLLGDFN
ncbi:MAG TPA: hypothetical protein VFQ92_13825 [Blastocatellia bacterium]|nr:hypothetical protein [Blastocatellia bacterium]